MKNRKTEKKQKDKKNFDLKVQGLLRKRWTKIATLYNRQNFDILEGMSIISIWQDILNHIH